MADLEKYIRDNIGELDSIEQVDENELWQKFNKKRKPARVLRLPSWAAAAAVALLIGITGVFIGYNMQSNQEPTFAQLVEADPALAETYQILISQINDKEQKVKAANIDKQAYQGLYDELQNLETIQAEFEKDIPSYGTQKELIRTLLKNYERKIRLLEILLFEIDKKSRYENLETYKNS